MIPVKTGFAGTCQTQLHLSRHCCLLLLTSLRRERVRRAFVFALFVGQSCVS